MSRLIPVLLLVLLIPMLPSTASTTSSNVRGSNVIIVPDDFPTVQDAIDNAVPNTVILVKQAGSSDTIIIDTKENITIKPYITGNSYQVSLIRIIESRNIRIEGASISANEQGLYVANSSNITLLNIYAVVTPTSSGMICFRVINSSDISIVNSVFKGNKYEKDDFVPITIVPDTVLSIRSSQNIVLKNTSILGYADNKAFEVSNISIKLQNVLLNVKYFGPQLGSLKSIIEGVNIEITSSKLYVPTKILSYNSTVIINGGIYKGLSLYNASLIRINGTTITDDLVLRNIAEAVIYGNTISTLQLSSVNGTVFFNHIGHVYTSNDGNTRFYSTSKVKYFIFGKSYYNYVGNYYDIYSRTLPDNDKDGIGDTPLTTPVHDSYPLAFTPPLINSVIRKESSVQLSLYNGETKLNITSATQSASIGYGITATIDGKNYTLRISATAEIMPKFTDSVVAVGMRRVISFSSKTVTISMERYGDKYVWINVTFYSVSTWPYPRKLPYSVETGVIILPDYVKRVVAVYYDGNPASDYKYIAENRTLIFGDPAKISILAELPTVLVNSTLSTPSNPYIFETYTISWNTYTNSSVEGYSLLYINGTLAMNATGLNGAYTWHPNSTGTYNITLRTIVTTSNIHVYGNTTVTRIVRVKPRPVNIEVLEYNATWINETHINLTLKLRVIDALNSSTVRKGYVVVLAYKNNSLTYNATYPITGTLLLNLILDPDNVTVKYVDPDGIYNVMEESLTLPENTPTKQNNVLTPPPLPEPPILPVLLVSSIVIAVGLGRIKRRN